MSASGAFRLPDWNDSFGWLMLYADALSGQHGEAWQTFADAHRPSGRTDGTSWKKWRDEASDAAKTMPAAETCWPCRESSVLCPKHLVQDTLAKAWEAVDQARPVFVTDALRSLGYGGGHAQAKYEALAAIQSLRDEAHR